VTCGDEVHRRFTHDPVFRARVEGARQMLTASTTLRALPRNVIAAMVHAHDSAQRSVDEIEQLGAELHRLHLPNGGSAND
jgi:hypothetical protein